MTRARAAAGSLLFLLIAPGVAAGVVPWWLTGWESTDPPLSLVYVAVTATIVGQAALLGQAGLLLWALVFMIAVAAFVYGYEQPTLSERFGAQYEDYCRNVPAWWPRLRPWTPTGSSSGRPSDGVA